MKRSGTKYRKNTIANRLFLPMVLLVGIFAMVFWGIVWYGGVFDRLKDSEVERVRRSLIQRATLIQDNVDAYWRKDENYGRLLWMCKNMKASVDSGAQPMMGVNDDIADMIGEITKEHGAQGAYVFFDSGSAYYIRRDKDNRLIAEFGEENYLTAREIAKSTTWKQGTGGDMTICPSYHEISEAKNSKPGLTEMDYACFDTDYQCGDSGEYVLTFSIPLLDGVGNIYAVVGIEVSSASLNALIPANDIRGTYMLGVMNTEKSFIERIVSQGEIYNSVLLEENGLWLLDNNKDGIYELGSEGARNTAEVLTKEIRFYPENSAFSHQSWVLCAIVDDSELAQSVDNMKNSIITALVCASLIGILGLFFLSRILTKPIATLVSSLNVLNPRKPVQLPKVNIYEVDRLSSAIERVSKEVEMYALRVSEILRIAEIPVGVAEIDEVAKEVYCTAQMFKLLGEVGEDQEYKVISIEEFKKIVEKFKRGTVIFEKGENKQELIFCDNNTYKVYSGAREAEWISFQTRETNGRLIVVIMDVTDKIKEKLKLEYERDFDELSRLLNKQAFARETKKRLSLETRPVGVMVMWDLDNLKYINDTYGHEYGDIYIREAAKIFAYLEQHNGLVARRSGDEFFAYVSGESEEELRELIYNIHGMLGDVVMKLPAGKEMKVRASAGLVWYPKDGSEYDDLIKKADFTMYDVKRSNKGSMQEFNKQTYEQDAVLLSGKEEMNEFLEKHLLKLAYQPIVDAVTGEIYGYEALMRPQTDTLHSPQDVIRIAKAQGKLINLEKMLWEETLKDYFVKQKNSKCKLFVNSFAGVLLEEKEQEKLREYGKGHGEQIVLELMQAQRVMLENVCNKKESAQRAGCQIALSDFGTGYNTEEKRLLEQVSYVKLGREFYEGIETDEERRKLVLRKIQEWHAQELMVIALGVENENELRFMQKCGVEFVQGFYLAKPSFDLVENAKAIKEKIMI